MQPERLPEHELLEHLGFVLRAHFDEVGAEVVAAAADDLGGCGIALGGHDADAVRLDDAGLVAGDLLAGVAEDGGVFERDRRDDRDVHGVEHVGRIEGATEPNFDHLPIDGFRLRAGEPEEESGHDAEGADVAVDALPLGLDGGADGLQTSGELLPGDGLAIEGDAFGVGMQVGAGEGGGGVPLPAKDRLDHGRGAALALRARDMDGVAPALGVVEPCE